MKKLILLSAFAFVILTTIGFFITNVSAEESKFRCTNYLTKVEYIPVPDVDKHVVGTYERRGIAVFENGEIASY